MDGETKELTRGELMVYVRHGRSRLCAPGLTRNFIVYMVQTAPSWARCTRHWCATGAMKMLTLRGYGSPISVRNLANDIPDEVVDTLLEVCQKNAGIFQRFFRLKARWLGVERCAATIFMRR